MSKNIFLIVLLAGFCWSCNSGPTSKKGKMKGKTEKMVFPKDSVAADGKTSFHGLRINETAAVAVNDVPGLVGEKAALENVKFKGLVDACCLKKGCWMNMDMGDGSKMRVTFKDYGFFVPLDSKGKEAIVEGRAYYDTTSVDMLVHLAMDGGMSEEDAKAKYTEPEYDLSFEATGVIMRDLAAE